MDKMVPPERKNRKYPAELVKTIQKMRREGHEKPAIASYLGIPWAVVKYWTLSKESKKRRLDHLKKRYNERKKNAND